VVLVRLVLLASLLFTLAGPGPAAGAGFHLVGTIHDPDALLDEGWGGAVAVARSQVLIGGVLDAGYGVAATYDVRTGVLVRRLEPEVPGDSLFGTAVATTAHRLLVSSRERAVYVYDRRGRRLRTIPRVDGTDGFSLALAAHGRYLAVGADRSMAAFLYDLRTGALLHDLRRPGDGPASFGRAVALAGNLLLVGSAPLGCIVPGRPGTLYGFDARTGALSWSRQAPVPVDCDEFGSALATRGRSILVGAPGPSTGLGAAYLLDARDGAVLATYAGVQPGLQFGTSVALGRRWALVGAPGANDVWEGGAAYLLDRRTGDTLATFGRPDGGLETFLGAGVALAGTRLVIGAPATSSGVGSTRLYAPE
jgi:outer membrane protein assembly factor BamB